MKNIVAFFVLTFLLIGCKNDIVKKPNTLIEREKMIEIIYDLSVLEALKSQTMGQQMSYPKPFELIKEKYHVDSLTFVQNTQYYASDLKDYKRMYNEVKKKIEAETAKLEGNTQQAPEDIEHDKLNKELIEVESIR